MKTFAAMFAAAALVAAAHATAKCDNCGTVTEMKTVEIKGEGSGVGAVAGGVIGGVLGHQVGGGRGKDVATVAGAVGGAYAGHQIEKNAKKKTQYQVIVRLENGTTRTFTYDAATAFKVGDKIKVENNKLVRM
jgi:outer membrane lipoprotein SlyB